VGHDPASSSRRPGGTLGAPPAGRGSARSFRTTPPGGLLAEPAAESLGGTTTTLHEYTGLIAGHRRRGRGVPAMWTDEWTPSSWVEQTVRCQGGTEIRHAGHSSHPGQGGQRCVRIFEAVRFEWVPRERNSPLTRLARNGPWTMRPGRREDRRCAAERERLDRDAATKAPPTRMILVGTRRTAYPAEGTFPQTLGRRAACRMTAWPRRCRRRNAVEPARRGGSAD